jgi:hypothetical protein
MEVNPMKRNDEWKDGMPCPDGMEDPSQYPELRLQTYAELPTPPRDDSRTLAALGLFDYEIGNRQERKGPAKKRVVPVIWLPGQGEKLDPDMLDLLLKLDPIGNA